MRAPVTQCLFLAAWASASPGATPTPVQTSIAAEAACPDPGSLKDGPSASNALAFATRLAELGPRPAASEGEARARAAVVAELEAIGLDVTTEPFQYQTFVVDSFALDLGGAPADPVIVGLNPFGDRLAFTGEAVVVTDPSQGSDALKGRIVVTNHPIMQLMIAEFDPAVVICVDPGDLEAFEARGNFEVSLEVTGRPFVLQSANVVARFGPRRPGQREILVTSHLDAYRDSPGANDNGTGLGVMVELARTFSNAAGPLDASLAFVAFGAEENGAIGSRAYLEDHISEMADVVAVVNLDTLGGARGPVIATTVSEQPEVAEELVIRIPEALRDRAWEGPDGRWRIIHPEIIPTAFTSNYPPWLQQVVAQSAAELGIEVVELDLISDHRTFALAGIPAISIQSKEHHIHSPEDTADVLVLETIEAGTRLAAEIIVRLGLGTRPPAAPGGRDAGLPPA